MDPFEPPAGRPSPRGELQGPRPAPLKVSKESCKIKKPPVSQAGATAPSHAPPQHRPPVIIYTVSPKVIHAEPSDFMALVQRLTGNTSSDVDPSTSSLPSPPRDDNYSSGGALSMEKTVQPSDDEMLRRGSADVIHQPGSDSSGAMEERAPGILSPVPSSLQPIFPAFFSSSSDMNSPSFWAIPSNSLAIHSVPSPSANWDLFNQFQDF